MTQTRNSTNNPKDAWGSNYVFTPTAALSLRCKTLYDGGHHRWADTPTENIEEQLNEYVLALVEIAVKQRAQKAYWAEQRRLEEAAARRRHEEAQRIRQLETETAAWHKSRQMRAYVAAVERVARRSGPIESGSELDKWCDGRKRTPIASIRYTKIRQHRQRAQTLTPNRDL